MDETGIELDQSGADLKLLSGTARIEDAPDDDNCNGPPGQRMDAADDQSGPLPQRPATEAAGPAPSTRNRMAAWRREGVGGEGGRRVFQQALRAGRSGPTC